MIPLPTHVISESLISSCQIRYLTDGTGRRAIAVDLVPPARIAIAELLYFPDDRFDGAIAVSAVETEAFVH